MTPIASCRRARSAQIGGRGGCLMLGYFDNQAATEASFNRDGWFMSGDLGVFDAARQPAHRRSPQGLDHPRRPQHLSGSNRGPRAAPYPGAKGRVFSGRRRAARRARMHRGSSAKSAPDDLLAHLAGEGLSRYDMPEFFVRLEAFR